MIKRGAKIRIIKMGTCGFDSQGRPFNGKIFTVR